MVLHTFLHINYYSKFLFLFLLSCNVYITYICSEFKSHRPRAMTEHVEQCNNACVYMKFMMIILEYHHCIWPYAALGEIRRQ